ncbi:putative non-specific serine/threonine protein kinase [Rosa chinensis]|uniref:Putative non-specific serine/threonine protein kinase n=1 Tax=Rosa chinensis TaxID=74649 RepID=A0A2P6RWU7_ROSCH|nr:putative non-specific serine/threonine protein kinase [Rosa chinensis]
MLLLRKSSFRCENDYISSEMACMVAYAAACIRHSSQRWPQMSQVVLQSSEVS